MKHCQKIKVLHVVGAMNRAGTETMLMNIHRKVNPQKIQFDFVSYDNKKAHYDEEINSLNGKVIRLTKTNSVKQIYQVIKEHGPYDVVHAHTMFHCGIAMLAAFLAGVKIRIAHAHTNADVNTSYVRRMYMINMRLLIRLFSTNILACSKAAGEYLFSEKEVMKEKYTFFPNPIDYTKYLQLDDTQTKQFRLEEGIRSKAIVIGHIGTFKSSKNHIFLLSIMERLIEKKPQAQLLLIGDGELRQYIVEKARQMNLTNNIKFLGVREDIPTILHSMDVFVFPSIYEGLGLVLLEAQASGLPCVVSNAIQPEANLELDLLEKLALTAGPDKWAEKIIQKIGNKEENINKITKHFEKSGYSLSSGIAILEKLYNQQAGEAYEENVNRLL